MSSQSAARLARAAMFVLEALEPRRFLSGEGAGQEQSGIPTDAVALRDHGWAEFHPGTDSGWFSFEAQAGTVYKIGSTYQNLRMLVYAPDGATEVAESEFAAAIFKADSEGTYFVKVAPMVRPLGYSENSYSLTLNSQGDADDSIAGWGLQSEISGKLVSDRDVDYVRFEATAGQTYIFNVAQYNIYTLLDSNAVTALAQVEIYQGAGAADGQLRWTAPYSGSFYISISTGTFCMCSPSGGWTLRAMPAPSDGGLEEATPISPDDPATGTISQAGQMNYLRFEAVEHAYYSFHINTELGERAAVVKVIGPRTENSSFWGINLRYDMDIGPMLTVETEWVAPQSGTFYLSVSFLDASATGAYSIAMREAIDDHGNNWASATLLEMGQPQSMHTDYLWDDDYFYFPALAGHTYLLTAHGRGDPWLRHAADPLLSQLDAISDGYRHSHIVAPAESRNYYFSFEGSYSVRVVEVARPLPEASAQDFNPRGSATISLDAPAAVHYLRFETHPGMEYKFTVDPIRNGNLGMYVVDASGQLADDRDVPQVDGSMIHRMSDSARTLYLAVVALDESQVGDYTIHLRTRGYRPPRPAPPPVEEQPPDEQEPTVDDEPEDAEQIETPFEVAAARGEIKQGNAGIFSFRAIAGRSYRFRTVLGTLEDSIVGLFDPATQKAIAVNDDTDDEAAGEDDVQSFSSQVRWTAEASGDVYVVVAGFDEASAGTYRLEVYSTSEAMKEETLGSASVPGSRATELVSAMDGALYADDDSSSDDSDVWDESQDGGDDSSDWLDSDVWDEDEEEEDWSDI